MAEIRRWVRRWVLVSPDDVEGAHEYDSYQEAEKDARQYGHAVIERVYEYSDSELVWTPDGSMFWPPDKED